ncbi:MAG TPA: hypothetical protein PLD58_09785 [Phycisphaerae bacterium]|nr:hypothetical protein [Phycisphaerae bacterium]
MVGLVVMALTCGAYAQQMRTVYRRPFNNAGPNGSTLGGTVVKVAGDNGTSAFLGNVGHLLRNTRYGNAFTRAGDVSTVVGLGAAASNHVGDPWGAARTLAYEGALSWGTGKLGSAVGTFVGGPAGTVVGGVAAHLATRGINGAYTYLTTPSGLEPGWQSTRGAALPRRGVSYYGSGHRPPQTPVVVNINATHPRYVHSTYNTGPHSPTVIKITPKTPSYTPRRTSTRSTTPTPKTTFTPKTTSTPKTSTPKRSPSGHVWTITPVKK